MTPPQFIDDRWRVIRDIAEAEGSTHEWEAHKDFLEFVEVQLKKAEDAYMAADPEHRNGLHRREMLYREVLDVIDGWLADQAAEYDIPLTTDGVSA